jgi:uncharacterized protein (TIGR02001 family)
MNGAEIARWLAVACVMTCAIYPIGAVRAEEPEQTKAFSAEITVVTDYVYRGVSFSEGHPAIQAYGEWSNAGASQFSGLHAGGWVSSIDFGPNDPAKAEVWGFAGYQGGKESLTYDVGIVYTTYPGAPTSLHYGYFEAYGSLGTKFGPMTLTGTAHYTPDYSGDAGRALFMDFDGEMPLTGPLKLVAGVGYADVKPAAGAKYTYWSLGVAATWHGFTAAVRYYGNDLRTCLYPCSDRVVLSVGKDF